MTANAALEAGVEHRVVLVGRRSVVLEHRCIQIEALNQNHGGLLHPRSPSARLLAGAMDASRRLTEALRFGGVALPVFATASREGLLEGSADLTGLMPWHGGRLIAQLLGDRPYLVRDARVGELGCGAGLLAAVAAAAGAACVVATDGVDAVLPLARDNVAAAVAAAPTTPPCAHDAALLRWGDAGNEADVLRRLAALSPVAAPRFDVLLASETFYVHRGDTSGASTADQAAALFGCARRLLRGGADAAVGDDGTVAASMQPMQPCPYTAGDDDGGCGSSGGRFCPRRSCGLLLLVYSPRYRGMGPGVRAGAAAAGMALATLHREGLQSREQAASLRFGSTRALAASPCAACLGRFVASEALPPGGASDDEDRWDDDGDGGALLAAVGAGLLSDDDDDDDDDDDGGGDA
jgi:predicted nicotinamide N-methyase